MSLNFSNRILTSLVLSSILLLCLFLNNFLWIYLLIVTSVISFFEFNNLVNKTFKKKKNYIYLLNIVSIMYLILFIYIGYEYNKSAPFELLFILLICIFSDTGGYLIGKTIGGKKLTKISPNKTISGSLGSFIFSIIPIALLWYFSVGTGFSFIFDNINKNIYLLVLICLFLSLVCQLGDLFFSYFKRKAKVKDTGSILPGHGGLLDRIDGIIFVLPVAFILDKVMG